MAVTADVEERRMRFEARKLAVETYIKVHVDRTAGARLLIASYFRLIFTLSLGTLAALVTLGSGWVRLGAAPGISIGDPVAFTLATATVISLIFSAILAANGLRGAAGWSIQSVKNPLPQSGSVIAEALRNDQVSDEEIFRHLMVSIEEMSHAGDLSRMSFLAPLVIYIISLIFSLLLVLRLSL